MSAESQPLRAGSIMTTLLVCASLGLNAFLVAKLFHRRPSLPSQPAPAVAGPVGKSSPRAAVATPTNAPPPFRWSEIESADYRQYIANLRAVGCPEQVIRDIIMADVNQLFAPRVAVIWKPRVREYWRKSKNDQPSPEELKQLKAISKDKAAVLQELLGVHLEEQGMINTMYLQVYGNEQNLLFLPEAKRAAALQALADADFEVKSEELHSREDYSNEVDQKLFNETLQTLAKVLSPAELEEFRLRGSPAANTLRNQVQYFNCTPDEFRQLVDWREHAGHQNLSDLLTAATAEVRKLFGDERAQEFARVTDAFYINTRRAAEEQGVSLELAEQAWQVTSDTRAAANSVAKNSDLSAVERTNQLQSLQQQAEARLSELLGPKTAAGVIFDLRAVVNWKPSP